MSIVPRPLIDEIAEGRCLPFIGAGFSANARLPGGETMPTWAGLTKALADTGSIDDGEGPDVAEEYERHFGRVGLIDAVRRSLHSDTARPGRAHSAFAQLPFDTVYTTNFDLLLEDACSEVRRPFRSLVGELQLPFHAGLLATNIVKMHGDLRHEEHVVITRSDYEGFLTMYPVIATHLSAMLITRTALFVGYSRTDPDFQQIVQVVRSRLGRFQRMSYLLQFDAAPDEIDTALDDQIHVISLVPATAGGRDGALADFFSEIQATIDKRAGATLRERRPDAFEAGVTAIALSNVLDQPSGVRVLEGSSHMCFVMMPFGREFDVVYYEGIAPVAAEAGLTPVRADEIVVGGMIVEQIRTAIQNSRLCVADVTGANPNVMYEVGIAQTMGKSVVLLCQVAETLPFDVASFRVITYEPGNMDQLSLTLRPFLLAALEEGKFDEAGRLVHLGMYAPAVSVLSVLLEQTLRRQVITEGLLVGPDEVRRLGLGQLVRRLSETGKFSDVPSQDLQHAIELRNATVHGAKEPSRQDAEFMLELVRNIVRRPGSSMSGSVVAGIDAGVPSSARGAAASAPI